MKKLTIKLTKAQREQIASLLNGQKGDYAILGEAFIGSTGQNEAGTANFYYLTEAQHAIIYRAIVRAQKRD
jgi:hypothetical protein